MSISATITGTVVYLLSQFKKLPCKITCILWVIPFLRMWIPVAINSKYSLMSFISKYTTKTITVYHGVADYSVTNCLMAAESYFPVTYKVNLLDDIFTVATIVWAIIALALIIATIYIYFSTKSEFNDLQPVQDNIYTSDKVVSPATYGIFKAKIILPTAYSKNDFKYILMHEKAHIKRLDNLWRMVAIITACIHWFNPFSWVFLKAFLENLELACDEAVMKTCNESEKKEYALTLLNCAECKNLLYSSAFGGAKIRVRLERILSYKKLSLFSTIAFSVLTIAIGYILLTNAK